MHIDYLADHPEFIPPLAHWHYDQWSYLCPGDSVERRIEMLHTHLGREQIPLTFVALQKDAVLGSASLVAYDMDTRMDLSPWLASVYVTPRHRRQGIGTALVRRVVRETEALGVQALHLYTPDKEPFYARLGWSVIERTTYRSYPQVVMALPIAGRPPGAGR